ncbi:TlpA disulfide reductase family protein [Ovoidimarina sediminis]|uniref:TlpA disulfide reductase family protein n=1 Tax=Ovoidimarina sediminis TaxID=3079856 RepID=UPI00290DD6DE|nr:TlpA disulfide reductase family protein [Rhodophyticola sp. MJ-SS7]MDU8946059.1 TlpA disulfide reductase family protein [Rhodophyticola sp. MJ-SS7]
MKLFWSAVLYTALAIGANAADIAALEAMREDSMRKLLFHGEPQTEVSEALFTDPGGAEYRLADWRGKYVLVNFWATWCAPCRKEMPALDALQKEFQGEAFEVVTLATGRNALGGINRFFEEEGIEALPILLDPSQAVARDMGVLGLPISVILDPEGREIARLRGDAEWYSDSARAIIGALVESHGGTGG